MERTARLDMTDALELSERTYLDLARVLCEALELSGGQLVGSAPLRHLSPGERERLASLRQSDLELLRTRLALTHTQSQRTSLQLQEAQREIHTLRERQAEAQQLRSRLESVCVDLQREREEAALLKEALDRTHTRLEHTHTRLERTHTHRSRPSSTTHTAAQRKAVCVDRQDRARGPHTCGQKTGNEEKLQERLRRREYELHTLKKQLSAKEEELTRVTSQPTSVTSPLIGVTSQLTSVTSPQTTTADPTASTSTNDNN